MLRLAKGFSLIELIVFLVIIGILISGIVNSFYLSMAKSNQPGFAARAVELAQGRMDIILGEKATNGFSSFSDPCSGTSQPAICQTTSGYTISSTITTGFDSNSNLKVITVTVSGNGSTTLTTLVGNYS